MIENEQPAPPLPLLSTSTRLLGSKLDTLAFWTSGTAVRRALAGSPRSSKRSCPLAAGVHRFCFEIDERHSFGRRVGLLLWNGSIRGAVHDARSRVDKGEQQSRSDARHAATPARRHFRIALAEWKCDDPSPTPTPSFQTSSPGSFDLVTEDR